MGVASKIKLSSIDSLLGSDNSEYITEINISELHSFKNHPFKILNDDNMEDLVESIKENGILTPVTVRMLKNSDYELISGHRRTQAALLAGLKKIPAIIKNLSDDEAAIAMVDSNIYREKILPSEKAYAYKIKQEALRHQGKSGLNTADEIGKDLGDSGRQVQRYIRLTNLIDELLEYVDIGKIKLIPAVNLSFLSSAAQRELYEFIDDNNVFPKLKDTEIIKEYFNENNCISIELLEELLLKKNLVAKKNISFNLPKNFVEQHFKNKNIKEVETFIMKLVKDYFHSEKVSN